MHHFNRASGKYIASKIVICLPVYWLKSLNNCIVYETFFECSPISLVE